MLLLNLTNKAIVDDKEVTALLFYLQSLINNNIFIGVAINPFAIQTIAIYSPSINFVIKILNSNKCHQAKTKPVSISLCF